MSLEIVVTDDHRLLREGLRSLLESPGGKHVGGISGREREILQLVAEGRSSKEMAASLYVSSV